jgi:hypothetical protein
MATPTAWEQALAIMEGQNQLIGLLLGKLLSADESALAEILLRVQQLDAKVVLMSDQQGQIDSDVQALTNGFQKVSDAETVNAAAVQAVADYIQTLKGGAPLDLTALDGLVSKSADAAQAVTDGVAAVSGLVPAAPPAP